MTPRAILRKEVPQDLGEIVDYFAANNPAAGARFIDAIDATLAEIVAHPGRGSPKHFRGAKYAKLRTWAVRGFPKYLVIYEPVDVGAVIVAITHGARNIRKLLRGRL